MIIVSPKEHRMPADQPDSLIRGLIDIAFNLGNFSAIEELFAPESITHIPAWGMPNNRLGLKQLIAGFRTAFPDLHCTVEDEIYTEDKVAAHWTLRGTHQGLFFGNQPTGRPVRRKLDLGGPDRHAPAAWHRAAAKRRVNQG
jgi:hypothetical protein